MHTWIRFKWDADIYYIRVTHNFKTLFIQKVHNSKDQISKKNLQIFRKVQNISALNKPRYLLKCMYQCCCQKCTK